MTRLIRIILEGQWSNNGTRPPFDATLHANADIFGLDAASTSKVNSILLLVSASADA